MQKAYNRTYWENKPSDKSPINERSLNKIEAGVDTIDDRVISLDTTKFDKADAQGLIRSLTFNRANGVFTITYVNGATATIDTMLEKLAVNFDFDENAQQLIIALDDGTEKRVDLSAFIAPVEFLESDTVFWQLQTDGKVKAIIKEGSIEEKHLQPNYLADIKVETAKAEASKNAAAVSEANAAESEKNAKDAEANAALSEADAERYKTDAETAAQNAKDSENASKISETNTKASEEAAKESEEAAGVSAREAGDSAGAASTSSADAADSAKQAEDFSEMSKSYAIGTDGVARPDDAADNSKFYSGLAKKLTDEAQKLLEQAQKIIAAASTGALIPAGTISFEDLPSEPQVGYMYNISNDFTTDSRFTEGEGIFYRAGANIYWTKDGQWDVMVGTQVTGVKGSSETGYRVGNVSIAKKDIGLDRVSNTADAEKFVKGIVSGYEKKSYDFNLDATMLGNPGVGLLCLPKNSNTINLAELSLTPEKVGAVNKAGDTMTGNLIMKNVALTDGVHSRVVMEMYDDGDGATNYGSDLIISAAGNTFIGGGESPANLRNHFLSDTGAASLVYGKVAERTYITADSDIFLYSNCNNISNKVNIVFDTTGSLRPQVNNTRSLGSSSVKWANVYATTFHGALDGNATSATTATKIGNGYVGHSSNPIFIQNGTPTASNATVGSSVTPVYMSNGTILSCSDSLRNNIENHAYITASVAYNSSYTTVPLADARYLLVGESLTSTSQPSCVGSFLRFVVIKNQSVHANIIVCSSGATAYSITSNGSSLTFKPNSPYKLEFSFYLI